MEREVEQYEGYLEQLEMEEERLNRLQQQHEQHLPQPSAYTESTRDDKT